MPAVPWAADACGEGMLKITLHCDETPARLVLEGKLAGPWIDEARHAWRESPKRPGSPLVVDLTGITFVDSEGKRLLSEMLGSAVTLHASGCLNRSIVEELTDPRCGDDRRSESRKSET